MLLLLLACADPVTKPGPATTGLAPRGDCNPIETGHCLLPFPSSFYLDEDPSTGSGYRVNFGPGSLPIDQFDNPMDPTDWNRLDGFPILGSLYAHLPGASVSGAATFESIDLSLEATSPTVILDAETGERVPHYVEREAFPEDPATRLLILRPVQPYQWGRRYVVAIRGLVDDSGGAAPAAPNFVTLRDGLSADPESPDHDDLERQRSHYDTVIFPALEAAGIARGELQLAWDFVVASESGTHAPMERVRDEGLAAVGEDGPDYTITNVEEGDCDGGSSIGRAITGTLSAPLFLESDKSGARAPLDEDGLPTQNGTYEAPFTVIIPCSVLAADVPVRITGFGHGLFGQHTDVYGYSMPEMAQEAGFIIAATTAKGMSIDDVDSIALMMATDPSNFRIVPDGLAQAQLDATLLRVALRGKLGDDPLLQGSSGSLVDEGPASYVGVSMGSVLGGAQVGMSDDIDRVVFQIPGGPFSLLLARSRAFGTFLLMLEAKYNDPMDVSLFLPLTQMLWDPSEVGGWATSLGSTSDGTPRAMLLQDGIGDDTVTSLAAHVLARSAGAGLLDPAVRPVWGLDLVSGPAERALMEVDYGYRESLEPAPQELDPDPHWMVTSEPAVQEMATHFLATGEILPTCEGACDPD